jgi:hypothetical protein
MGQELRFRLPHEGLPLAVLETDYGFRGGRLMIDGRPVLALGSREALEAGARATVLGKELELRLIASEANPPRIALSLGGEPALREDRLSAPPSRSAWAHGVIALLGSFFGFAASSLYLDKAHQLGDPWALKMAIHMAGWHLILTLSLFPASVWGQRLGIRAVQGVSALFFVIHLGIALANSGAAMQASDGPAIATFNALSGLLFLAAVIYGQRAHADMDPLAPR